MEDYKVRRKKREEYEARFINEYKELKERYEKLKKMLYKYKNNMLDFTPNCSYGLLRSQQEAMGEYLGILEERAIIEGIEL